jgi:hypothetical protein
VIFDHERLARSAADSDRFEAELEPLSRRRPFEHDEVMADGVDARRRVDGSVAPDENRSLGWIVVNFWWCHAIALDCPRLVVGTRILYTDAAAGAIDLPAVTIDDTARSDARAKFGQCVSGVRALRC